MKERDGKGFFKKLPRVDVDVEFHRDFAKTGLRLDDITCAHEVITEGIGNSYSVKIYQIKEGSPAPVPISSKRTTLIGAVRTHYAAIKYFKEKGQ